VVEPFDEQIMRQVGEIEFNLSGNPMPSVLGVANHPV
jgi:hypothetical protein